MWTLVVDRGVSFASAFDSLKAAHDSASTASKPEEVTAENNNAAAEIGTNAPAEAADCPNAGEGGAAHEAWNTKEGNFGFWKVILLLANVLGIFGAYCDFVGDLVQGLDHLSLIVDEQILFLADRKH